MYAQLKHLFALTLQSLGKDGARTTIERIRRAIKSGALGRIFLSRPSHQERGRVDDKVEFYPGPAKALRFRNSRVLLIAELSIPQCKKYRVDQKAEALRLLGIETTIVSWNNLRECKNALQYHHTAIFYRVPGYESVLDLISEAKRLGVKTFWEVDDLIFDAELYSKNRGLGHLQKGERLALLTGADLYRAALLACDEAIASTRTLAELMRAATGRAAHVVENALDRNTIDATSRVRATPVIDKDHKVRIVYGSGSNTHDADFAVVSEAMVRLMRIRPEVIFRVIGPLGLPQTLLNTGKVERFTLTSYDRYLALAADCDIAIAPLEPSVFNDAKSNIKWLEASVLGLPLVASNAAAFSDAIIDGETGLVVSETDSWLRALTALVDDPSLRSKIAQAAETQVRRQYDLETIAHQLSFLTSASLSNTSPAAPRILIANVFYKPRSFGGATIVAEEMADRLLRLGWEVYVFTTWSNNSVEDFRLIRYNADGETVFGIKVPGGQNDASTFGDSRTLMLFDQVIEAVGPNIVHLHSIQELGMSLADSCQRKNIPYVVTLHDAWWLCERQFMVTAANQYCYQRTIDLNICALCLGRSAPNTARMASAMRALNGASLVLAPSTFFADLYRQNGIEKKILRVNKNGVRPPAEPSERTNTGPLVFGFVGGNQPIKGSDLIQQVFREIDGGFRLKIVDPMINLGRRSISASDWCADSALVDVVPAYSMDTMDEFFDSIDVLLFPTRWKESFGLTVREALIRGVWVIATDAGGVVEDIESDTGTIISLESNVTELKSAVLSALSSTHIRSGRLARRQRSKVRTIDQQANELNEYLRASMLMEPS